MQVRILYMEKIVKWTCLIRQILDNNKASPELSCYCTKIIVGTTLVLTN